jgi:hypothetical protein
LATDEQMVDVPPHKMWALVFRTLGPVTGIRTLAVWAWRNLTRRESGGT